MGEPTALVILAEGAEEMEAVISVDVMRRGGIKVTLAGHDGPDPVTCSRGVMIKPDCALDDVMKNNYNAVVIPGGLGGAKICASSSKVKQLLKEQETKGGVLAAICAGPLAFHSHGIGQGKKVTSHPSVKEQMTEGGHYTYTGERVVIDGKVVTSQGPGTSFEFGLALVEVLQGKEKSVSIAPPMILK